MLSLAGSLALKFLAEFFIFTIPLLGFNTMLGYGRTLSLSHVGFFILGYSALLISFELNIPFFAALLIPALLSLVFSYVLATSSLKFGSYFVIAAFAFMELARKIVAEEIKASKHCLNIRIFEPAFLIPIFVFSFAAFYAANYGLSSRFASIFKALKEDSTALVAFGENPEKLKTLLFVISSFFAAISGSLYAYYIGFNFEHLQLSLVFISSAILGSGGNLKAMLAGFVLLLIYGAFPPLAAAALIWAVLMIFIIKSR